MQFDRSTAVMLGALMFIAWRAGLALGRRLSEKAISLANSKFDDASLALLGLLLAFTFSLAATKYDVRRQMVVADSNAIEDFYTCATTLREPVRTELQDVVRDYIRLRLDVARQPQDAVTFAAALKTWQTMHNRMTELVGNAISDGTPIAVSLTNSLNAVTSNFSVRLAAIEDRLPTPIIVLLLVSAVLSTLLVGREQGATGQPEVLGTLAFIFLVTLTVFVILDLNQSQHGLITVSQQPMQRLLDSVSK